MPIEMRNPGRVLTPADISDFERAANFVLPRDYVDFLLLHNGGRPSPKNFPISGLGGNPFGQVLDFFGIDDEVQSCDLLWNFRTYRGRLPGNFLAIGCEDGGSQICLASNSGADGGVYYFDGRLRGGASQEGSIYLISDSFRGFLASLFDLSIQ